MSLEDSIHLLDVMNLPEITFQQNSVFRNLLILITIKDTVNKEQVFINLILGIIIPPHNGIGSE